MPSRPVHDAWPDRSDDRVRVLLECPPESSPAIIASVIERHGYDVRSCEGPDQHRCDLHENGVCALVDGADVVVNLLRTRSTGPSVLDEVVAIRRPPAVVAERTHPRVMAARNGTDGVEHLDADGVTVIEAPMTGRTLIEAIEQAAGRTGSATRPDQSPRED
jgi:hypothetical protein